MSFTFDESKNAVVRPTFEHPQPRLDDWVAQPLPPENPDVVPDVMDFLADLDQRRSALRSRLRSRFHQD
jgi:hypothetical protein